MWQGVYAASVLAFLGFTSALAVNLVHLQKGTRALAPAPFIQFDGGQGAAGAEAADGVVILNSAADRKTIAEVQAALATLGYRPGAADGSLPAQTRAAIMAYEYDHGLPLTARADDVQLARLLGLSAPPGGGVESAGHPETDEARAVIAEVQRALASIGYEPGGADGTLTSATTRAIRNYEIDNRLPETGRVSGRLVGALSDRAKPGRLALSRDR